MIKTALFSVLHGGPAMVSYSEHDQYTSDRAAGSVNGTPMEPGPGTRAVTDTGSNMSIASGLLTIGGQAAAGDPGLWGGLRSLAAGLAFRVGLRSDPNAATYIHGGWDNGQSGSPRDYILYKPDSERAEAVNALGGIGIPELNLPRGVLHDFALVHRGGTNGMLYFVKPNGGLWVLYWPGSGDASASLYATVGSNNYVSANSYADNWQVARLSGPFYSANGYATQVLAGSRAQGDVFTHTADGFIEFVCTTLPSSGQHEIQFRRQDAANYWQVTIDNTGNLDLDEIVDSTPAQRGTSAGVIANGERVVIRMLGSTIGVLEGSIGQNSRINYTSASNFTNETVGSLLTLGSGGAISNLITWPRVAAGSALYILNLFFP